MNESNFWDWREELGQALRAGDWVSACAAQGDCEPACRDAMCDPAVAAVLDRAPVDALARELDEYGCWNAEELADHDENLLRAVWLVAGDLREEEGREANGHPYDDGPTDV